MKTRRLLTFFTMCHENCYDRIVFAVFCRLPYRYRYARNAQKTEVNAGV